MTVDRVFVITLAQKYQDIVTLKTLKVITIILILFCVTFTSITASGVHHMMLANNFWLFYLGDLILKVISLVVVILAHLYILNFIVSRSQAVKDTSPQKSEYQKTDKNNYLYMHQSVNF